MKILAIETSCDDTSIAILEAKNNKFKILSNIISSQVKLHAKYGGVYPFLAKREHQKNLPIVLKKALKEAGEPKIDLIAVTAGPGLEPCLWTGINFAKELAKKLKTPIVPINHIEAHILANKIGENFQSPITQAKRKVEDEGKLRRRQTSSPSNFQTFFQAVCLVVSGGHTQLILMKDIDNYKILGETRDDAAGECFDKTARILGLGYPGGPAIAAEAAKFKISNLKFKISLPRPMINQKNYDFSFSGLKTAVLYLVKELTKNSKRLTTEQKQAIATEIQQAIIDVLIAKTIKAAKDYKAKSIILGGGVAANDELRRQFNLNLKSKNLNLKFLIPPKIFCTDNAAMVAVTAHYQWQRNKSKNQRDIKANANLRLS